MALSMVYGYIIPGVQVFAYDVRFRHAQKRAPLLRSHGGYPAVTPPRPIRIGRPDDRTSEKGRAAPDIWGRVAAIARCVRGRLFWHPHAKYAEGCFSVEPEATADSAFEESTRAAELIGLTRDPGEAEKTNEQHRIARRRPFRSPCDFGRPPPKRGRDDLSGGSTPPLERERIGPSEAAKFRGLVGYPQTLMFGRADRALPRPFSERRRDDIATTRPAPSPPLSGFASWRVGTTESPERRHCSEVGRTGAAGYADASGDGRVGAPLLIEGRKRPAHTHSPERLMRYGAGIPNLEPSAKSPGVTHARDVAPGRPGILC